MFGLFFRPVRKIAKSDCCIHYLCMSVPPCGKTLLALEVFCMKFGI